jgi:diacylglycerol kinase family enzyme
VIVQNSDPFTYFSRRPIRVCEGAGLDTGTLSLAALKKATVLELPTLIPRVFSGRARTVQRHRQVEGFPGLTEARVESVDERPFPVQVDGDFIGHFDEVEYGILPGGLVAVA